MARFARYRVNANVQGLKYGETVEIDPDHQHWAPLIERDYLVPEIPPLEPTVLDAAPPAKAPRKRTARTQSPRAEG